MYTRARPHPGGGEHPPPTAIDDTANFRTRGYRLRDEFAWSRAGAVMSARKRDEPVRLTRIYTRGGDRGETSLGDGSRVPKLDCRIGAFGAVDELNSQLGLVLAAAVPDRFRPWLERIQNDLFDVGADLSVPFGVTDRLRVTQAAVDGLERRCDELNADLPELRSFILPGGTDVAARLHVARTVCRRAEREALVADREHGIN